MITGVKDELTNFLLVRHAKPANLDPETQLETFYATPAYNPPLGDEGRNDMFTLGTLTRGIRFDQIVASGLKRAQESAEWFIEGRQGRFRPAYPKEFEINPDLNDASYTGLDKLPVKEGFILDENGARIVHLNQLDPYADIPLPVIKQKYEEVMKQSALNYSGGNIALFLHSPVALLYYSLLFPDSYHDKITYQECVDAGTELQRGDYIIVSVTSLSWQVEKIIYRPTREQMLKFFGVSWWRRILPF